MRHLVFVTDVWVNEPLLGVTEKHPLGLAPTFVEPMSEQLDVSLAEVIAAREDRMGIVRALIDDETRFGMRQLQQPPASCSTRSGTTTGSPTATSTS